MALRLVSPAPGGCVRDELLLDAQSPIEAGCVELEAAQVKVAFAWAVLGQAQAAAELSQSVLASHQPGPTLPPTATA